MEPKKLRILLIVGICAMVASVVCFIGVSSFMQSVRQNAAPGSTGETVFGGMTWDEILAAGSHERADVSPSTEPSPTESIAPEAAAEPPAEEAAAEIVEPSAAEEVVPENTPAIMIGSGLVPYDNRKFEVSAGGVPEAGNMKLLTFTRQGEVHTTDITWEMDVRSAEDVHVMLNGERLGDKDTVVTGTVVELYDGDQVVDTALVVIPGDVTGTGVVDASQLAVLERAVNEPDLLQGGYFIAGDLDSSGTIDRADVVLMQALIGQE